MASSSNPNPGDIREARERNTGKKVRVNMRWTERAPRCPGKETSAHPVITMGQKTAEQARGGLSVEFHPGGA